MSEQEPPTETFSYVAPKQVGFCDKCKRPICELATFTTQRFSTKTDGRDWLVNYIEKKLRDSGVIPEDMIHRMAVGIMHSAIRHGTHKQPDGKFACIDQADFEIKWRIKNPPPPISRTRFSLQAFINQQT